jgi:hypothetical protein
MSNEVIFYTQIASIIAFIIALFGIYRSLVAQKDGVIELLKEKLEAQNRKIQELESQTPDALAKALSARIEISLKEIERLKKDSDKHTEEIKQKEDELHSVQSRLSELSALIQEMDLVCPKCGSPLSRRECFPIYGEVHGREVEAYCEYTEYECGLSVKDGEEVCPCKSY